MAGFRLTAGIDRKGAVVYHEWDDQMWERNCSLCHIIRLRRTGMEFTGILKKTILVNGIVFR